MDTKLRPIITGAMSFVPGINLLQGRRSKKGTGGTNDAKYCYDTWMKHLILLNHAGMTTLPVSMGELGPGDSLGVGLMAMLCGVSHYRALDIIAHANVDRNLEVFEQLVKLLHDCTVPVDERHLNYEQIGWIPEFPRSLLQDDHLACCLAPRRLETIRSLIRGGVDASGRLSMEYVTPWSSSKVIEPASIDLMISHSVLEHVDHLDEAYTAMDHWLAPGGWMSHSIDYRSHGLSNLWNGYRDCPEWMWTLLRGKGFFSINREPHSSHMRNIARLGYEVRYEYCKIQEEGSLSRNSLTPRWRNLSDKDLYCSHAFVQCRKSERL